MNWLWFLFGTWFGVAVGFALAAILTTAKRADEATPRVSHVHYRAYHTCTDGTCDFDAPMCVMPAPEPADDVEQAIGFDVDDDLPDGGRGGF